jgi:hypothetical protein
MIWPAATLFAVGVIWFTYTLHPLLSLLILTVTGSLVLGEWLYQAQLLPNWMMFALDKFHDRPPEPEKDVRVNRAEDQPETDQAEELEEASEEKPIEPETVAQIVMEEEHTPEPEIELEPTPEVTPEPVYEVADSRPSFLDKLEQEFNVTIEASEELWPELDEEVHESEFRTEIVVLQGMFEIFVVKKSDHSIDLVPQ